MPAYVTFAACVCVNTTPGVINCIAFQPPVLMSSAACGAFGVCSGVRYNGVYLYFQGEALNLVGDICTFVETGATSLIMYYHSIDDPVNTLSRVALINFDGSETVPLPKSKAVAATKRKKSS